MTREEAIELLNQYNLYSPTKQIEEAIDMAIESLSQPIVAKHFDIQSGYIYCSPQIAENVKVVVRCKECRYFKKIAERSDSGLCNRDIVASAWKENGYCSRGKSKGGDTE